MCLRQVKPTTSSQRKLIQVNYGKLTKVQPARSLVKGLSNPGGRNNHGRLTAFRKGGGHKRKYRLVDFKRMRETRSFVIFNPSS